MLLAGCGSSGSQPAGSNPPAKPVFGGCRVLLIGLDGADWEIIHRLSSQSRLPNLARLEREGASGVLHVEEPLLSPVIWTTIATGRPATDHGIFGFLTSQGDATQPVRSDERKVRAFWNVASDLGIKVGVVGWYATWPAERVDGYLVSDRLGTHQVAGTAGGVATGLAYPDSLLPEIEALRAQVEREVGDRAVARFFKRGEGGGATVRIRQETYKTFLDILRTTELYRRLTPLLMERYDPAISAVYFEGTDSVGHLFAQFAPPPLPGVDAESARHLGEAFDRYYEQMDAIVGELVSRVDPAKTTVMVMSDHGFKTGARRPRTPAVTVHANQAPLWHRPDGMLLLWGRGVKPGATLQGATAYDVLPTLCRLAGLPLAATLKGRPLDEAFPREILAQTVRRVEDYEAAGPREMPGPAEASSDEQIAKLRALGYIGGSPGEGSPRSDGGGAAAARGQEGVLLNRFNKAVILANSGKREEALRTLRALQHDAPAFALGFLGEGLVLLADGDARSAVPFLEKAAKLDPRVGGTYADRLGEAYVGAGRENDGIRVLKAALARDPSNGRVSLGLGLALLRRGDHAEARRLLDVARQWADSPADRALGCAGLGDVAVEENRLDEAAARYEEALRIEPDLPAVLDRAAAMELRLGRPARAVELIERLLRKSPATAENQALYGRALAAAGRGDEARRAFEKSLALDPRQPETRRLLDRLAQKAP
jgi:predicted Zn-dependent protease